MSLLPITTAQSPGPVLPQHLPTRPSHASQKGEAASTPPCLGMASQTNRALRYVTMSRTPSTPSASHTDRPPPSPSLAASTQRTGANPDRELHLNCSPDRWR